MKTRILIIGACGQIGSELTLALRENYGNDNVIASDIREGSDELMASGPFEILDATDKTRIKQIIEKYAVTDVYLMAAMLSATAEKHPQRAWDLNMASLSHILDMARDRHIKKIFWPSSIAVFGPTTPPKNTPQKTVMEPLTVYGISKLAGERWCEYFHTKFGIDIRSIRYPGIISHKTLPGGGTTDYAVDIYHKAVKGEPFDCFLKQGTILPMMFMDDAIAATIQIMQADPDQVKIRSSYNLAAISFAPENIAESIKKYIPEFEITYTPDYRQQIADGWPESIDDTEARNDWGWKHRFDLDTMSDVMINALKSKICK
ncbi:NAD-dependent epimerase/dehydratase family protein [Ascidiimonas aurantiaca]|uniref:NAD-dependent epimerase/dehydratase family protein n=1 Tax=Ascidiimonas aurantiaca TaxID=1685432 RepID=UPI0030EB54BF